MRGRGTKEAALPAPRRGRVIDTAISLGAALMPALLCVPGLGLLSYRYELSARYSIPVPSGPSDALGMLECCLGFALFPTIGAVYGYVDRNNPAPMAIKILGASIAALITLGAQFLTGGTIAAQLGVDPSADSREALQLVQHLYGVLLIPLILIGATMALALVCAMTATPAIIVTSLWRRAQHSRTDSGSQPSPDLG